MNCEYNGTDVRYYSGFAADSNPIGSAEQYMYDDGHFYNTYDDVYEGFVKGYIILEEEAYTEYCQTRLMCDQYGDVTCENP